MYVRYAAFYRQHDSNKYFQLSLSDNRFVYLPLGSDRHYTNRTQKKKNGGRELQCRGKIHHTIVQIVCVCVCVIQVYVQNMLNTTCRVILSSWQMSFHSLMIRSACNSGWSQSWAARCIDDCALVCTCSVGCRTHYLTVLLVFLILCVYISLLGFFAWLCDLRSYFGRLLALNCNSEF